MFISLPLGRKRQSITHGQCDAGPTVTFPATGHHRPLTGNKLHCLATEAHASVLRTTCPRLLAEIRTAWTRTLDPLSRKSTRSHTEELHCIRAEKNKTNTNHRMMAISRRPRRPSSPRLQPISKL